MLSFPEKKLYITDTIFRDAHQSLAATRMKTEDMLPVCALLDEVGYWSLECWGGATFDACMRYLDEDPWERLRSLKKALPKTILQMLLRGRNLLGYRHYPDEVIDLFCKKSIENGIDVIRVFDALNDVDNLVVPMNCIKKYGAICEAAICYTVSPVHTLDYFVNLAVTLEKMGADVICIKDMSNLLLPADAYNLVSGIKAKVKVPLHVHTHNTAGTGEMVYMMASLAGCDIIDCALSPFANGTSQPATETMVTTFRNTPRDTGINLEKLTEASKHLKNVSSKMIEDGIINPRMMNVEPNTLLYQMPGGMFSNMVQQLTQANALDRLDDVLREIPEVRADFGYPPLVTPTSQIVGTQAVLNVISGKRYSSFTNESKMLLAGFYGRLPGEINQKVYDMAFSDKSKDIPENKTEAFDESMIENKNLSDEDKLSIYMFPSVASEFLKRRNSDEQIHEIEVVWNNNN